MGAVGVDTGGLLAQARVLSEGNEELVGSAIGAGDVGSARSGEAFERFHGYWNAGLSALTGSVESSAEVLKLAAGVYQRRDAESAAGFRGMLRAF